MFRLCVVLVILGVVLVLPPLLVEENLTKKIHSSAQKSLEIIPSAPLLIVYYGIKLLELPQDVLNLDREPLETEVPENTI